MCMRTIITLLFLGIAVVSYAHNIFVNGGMEDEAALENRHRSGKEFIYGWYATTTPSPTYFYNKQIGKNGPTQGKGFMGLKVYTSNRSGSNHIRREYIQGVFKEPLVAGKEYYLSFDLALHETSRWALSNLGILFSNEKKKDLGGKLARLDPDIHLNQSMAVDHQRWKTYYVRYVAKGGERSLIFGAFGVFDAKDISVDRRDVKDGAHQSAFYYLDNFVLSKKVPELGCFVEQNSANRKFRQLTMIVDFSTSMKDNNLLKAIKDGVIKSIQGFGPQDRVALVGFSSDSKLLFEGTKAQLTRDTLSYLVNKARLSGSTNLYSGLKHAWDLTENNASLSSNQLVLISDGEFTISQKFKALLLSPGEREVHFMHIGHKKLEGGELIDLGIKYVATNTPSLANDMSQAVAVPLFANSCPEYERYQTPFDVSFVVDGSGSMNNKHDYTSDLLNGMLEGLEQNVETHISLSSEDNFDWIIRANTAALTPDTIRSLVDGMPFEDGTNIAKGYFKSMIRHGDGIKEHFVVAVADWKPYEKLFDEDKKIRRSIEYPRERLILVYMSEDLFELKIMEYDPKKHKFVDMPEDSIPLFIQHMISKVEHQFYWALRDVRLDKVREKALKNYRKEHKLLK